LKDLFDFLVIFAVHKNSGVKLTIETQPVVCKLNLGIKPRKSRLSKARPPVESLPAKTSLFINAAFGTQAAQIIAVSLSAAELRPQPRLCHYPLKFEVAVKPATRLPKIDKQFGKVIQLQNPDRHPENQTWMLPNICVRICIAV
jgi:hypothetical protein